MLAFGLLLGACSQLPPSLGGTKPSAPPPPKVMAVPPPAPAPQMQVQAPQPPPPPPMPVKGLPNRSGVAAILVPLSGPQAGIGAALLNAAQMAVFEVGDDSFTLLPIDTKGTAEGAQAAALAAVNQHAEIILGPLFAAETRAVTPVARQAGLSVLSFTSDRQAVGTGTYTLGFLPGPQAVQVAAYARSTGKTRLGILAPSNDYGRRMVEFLQNDSSSSSYIAAVQYYDPNATDLTAPVKRMVKVNPKQPDDVGFDALLLPDEGSRLRNLAAMLSMQGVDPAKVKLLGTMLWADSNPGSEMALVGAWYAAPPQAGHADFEARYLRAFGTKPPRIASLGYDAAALAAVIAKRGGHDFNGPALTVSTGFAGIDGIFRLLPDGTSERGYAIDEVQSGGQPAKEVSPAPGSF